MCLRVLCVWAYITVGRPRSLCRVLILARYSLIASYSPSAKPVAVLGTTSHTMWPHLPADPVEAETSSRTSEQLVIAAIELSCAVIAGMSLGGSITTIVSGT